jgi:hypothetical protein
MDENNVPQAPPDDDRTPTQEDAAPVRKGGDWVMPEPVFRKSSGYLPKGFEQRVRAAAAAEPAPDTNEVADDTGEPAAMPAAVPEEDGIAEQPHVTEEPTAEGVVMAAPVTETTAASPKKRRGFFGWLLIIVGVILIAGAVAAIATFGVLWYFFQTSPSENF